MSKISEAFNDKGYKLFESEKADVEEFMAKYSNVELPKKKLGDIVKDQRLEDKQKVDALNAAANLENELKAQLYIESTKVTVKKYFDNLLIQISERVQETGTLPNIFLAYNTKVALQPDVDGNQLLTLMGFNDYSEFKITHPNNIYYGIWNDFWLSLLHENIRSSWITHKLADRSEYYSLDLQVL